jgi:hypothetical protein
MGPADAGVCDFSTTGRHMTDIIDFHTHAFPDAVAANAIPYLEEEGHVKAFLDGTVSSLLASMDEAGVESSVICSIATKPKQFAAILAWSKEIRSERIIPFPSFHPADPDCLQQIRRIRLEGFKGIKMHPYYQDFFLDEERLFPIYEEMCKQNLILVMHTGFDIAFPRIRRADPAQIARVLARFPELRMVTTHLGAWDQWDEVLELLAGRPIYMELSYTLDFLAPERARKILEKHPSQYLLFGTDSPWGNQSTSRVQLEKLGLEAGLRQRILRDNALALLNSG